MNPLGRWLPWHSLRARISLVLIGLTLALGITALVQAKLDLTAILEERLQNRGLAIAKDLAARSAVPSQTNDIFSLYEVINDSLLNNEDVRYVLLTESAGTVRVHTFEGGVPPGLAGANKLAPGELQRVRLLRTSEGPVLDIAVPVLQGQGGVLRVGMSETGLRRQVVSYLRRLSLMASAAVVGAIIISLLVSSFLTRPLARLARAARRVGSGDFTTRVPVDGRDEMGDLARAFNSMTDALRRSQESLILRNLELGILNSMADTLSRQLTQEQVLLVALDRLLELTRFPAAWVCTRDPQGRLALAACRGVRPRVFAGGVPTLENGCGCEEVFRTGRGAVLEAASNCSLVAEGDAGQAAFGGRAVVPLWSHDSVAAVLCVAAKEPGAFDEGRLRLLISIGQQMGIALQNAALYRELETKERMRAELLAKLIGAQEEERKRIAREIHDEPSQELTGVMLQLDKVEQQLAPHEQEQREVERLRRRVRVAMESLHRIITELRPQALDDLGFLPAIRWYAQQRLGEQEISLDFQVAGRPDRLPPPLEVAVFRITQEAVNNIAKHSRADLAKIRLRFEGAAISGDIEDNGEGFDPAESPRSGASERVGLGLLGMQERAELLGGSLAITSSPGRGTRVSFQIPLPRVGVSHG